MKFVLVGVEDQLCRFGTVDLLQRDHVGIEDVDQFSHHRELGDGPAPLCEILDVLGQGARVDEQFSVEVGAVRYTERFGLAGVVAPDVLRGALAAIAADLSRIEGRPPPDALVAMGGAVTNIAAVKHGLSRYDPNVVQGTALDRAEIDRQIEMYRSRDAAERRSIVGLQPKRADVILAGACIVKTVMDKLGQGSLIVSDRGLRHGVLVERFGG